MSTTACATLVDLLVSLSFPTAKFFALWHSSKIKQPSKSGPHQAKICSFRDILPFRPSETRDEYLSLRRVNGSECTHVRIDTVACYRNREEIAGVRQSPSKGVEGESAHPNSVLELTNKKKTTWMSHQCHVRREQDTVLVLFGKPKRARMLVNVLDVCQ